MRLTSALGALTIATALVLVPGSSQAEVKAHTDATGDVFVSPESDGAGENFTPAPDRVEGDVTGVRVAHRANKVKLTLRYRELSRTGFANIHSFRIRTEKVVRDVTVFGITGHWRGEAEMSTARGRTVSCALSHTIDYATNRVTVLVPRSCLSNPRWVRVGAAGIGIDDDGNTYADDARSTGLHDSFVLGPRVRRS